MATRRYYNLDPSPQTLRALWDAIHDVTEAHAATSTLVTSQQATILAQQASLDDAHKRIRQNRILTGVQATVSPGGATTSPTGGSGGGTGPQVPVHLDIVQSVLGTMPLNSSSTAADWFAFIQEVVWQISLLGTDPPGMLVGLLHQDGGDGVYTCAGDTYACFRLCYDNGANIKVLTGSFTAQWTPEAAVPIADWRAPVDPASPC